MYQRQQLGLNARTRYLPLLWPVWQSGAAVEHNDVILSLGSHTTGRVTHMSLCYVPTTTTGIEASRTRYLPLLWPVRQSGAAVEHNDVILTNLMTSITLLSVDDLKRGFLKALQNLAKVLQKPNIMLALSSQVSFRIVFHSY
jgi:hypothetical protein